MNWRQFKTLQMEEKVEKVEKPPILSDTQPFSNLNTFPSSNQDLKIQATDTTRPDPLPPYQRQLADEAERRADFCHTHREMKEGCPHHGITKGYQAGDRIAALNECLLWQLVCCGEKIERAAPSEIVGGVTVGDVLRWVSVNSKDLEAIRKERRLLLTCAEALQGAGHFWEN